MAIDGVLEYALDWVWDIDGVLEWGLGARTDGVVTGVTGAESVGLARPDTFALTLIAGGSGGWLASGNGTWLEGAYEAEGM